MHPDSVGLTLDRNRLEAVGVVGRDCDSANKGNLKAYPINAENAENAEMDESINFEINQIAATQNRLKAAFAQSVLQSESSRSFRIERIKASVMVGCVDSEVHADIGAKLNYQSFENVVYGIGVSVDGTVTLFCKGRTPQILPQVSVHTHDTIELTFHSKQSTLIIAKYSSIVGSSDAK